MATQKGDWRKLTAGEITLARLIFQGAINYDTVKIHYGKYAFFQGDDVVMAPNGEIYFPTLDTFCEDFSVESPRRKQLFIHEMTHVWQYQLGYPVKVEGVSSWMKSNYRYTLDSSKKLSGYRMEAQGNLLADYFILIRYGEPSSILYEAQYRGKTSLLSSYKAVLKDFIANPGSRANLPKSRSSNDDIYR